MQRPSQVTVFELIFAMSLYPQLQDRIVDVISRYFDDFVGKKQTYIKQDGYRNKILAATLAGDYLSNINRNKPDLANKYKTYVKEFNEEQLHINETSRW
jgi:hypothetical protein